MKKLNFLTSTRFWALIIAGLAIIANDNFSKEGIVKGIIFIVSGFTAVKTLDRASEKMGK